MNKLLRPPTPLSLDADLTIPPSEQKTVLTLLADDCRWPFGDPLAQTFHFCGKPNVEGGPYCKFHMERAFQVARPRIGFYRPIRG